MYKDTMRTPTKGGRIKEEREERREEREARSGRMNTYNLMFFSFIIWLFSSVFL